MNRIKSPKEIIKESYKEWVIEQGAQEEEAAEVLAKSFIPGEMMERSAVKYAKQFIDDPESYHGSEFDKSTNNNTVKALFYEYASSGLKEPFQDFMTRQMNARNILPSDIINIECIDGRLVVFYHSQLE